MSGIVCYWRDSTWSSDCNYTADQGHVTDVWGIGTLKARCTYVFFRTPPSIHRLPMNAGLGVWGVTEGLP